jgi:4-alpha-glucanotransferase
VGEDLGTVPEEVRLKMNEHRLNRLFVFQYEADTAKPAVVAPPDANTVASLNTHDMPMWTAYWRALDLDDRQSLGLLTPEQRAKEEESRAQIRRAWVAVLKELELLDSVFTEKDESKVLNATLNFLGESSATLVLLNLEDAFFETRPQNTPGTFRERKNWLGRMPQPLKSLELDTQFKIFIETLQRSRRDARQKSC